MPSSRDKVLLVFFLLYLVLMFINSCGSSGVLSEVRVSPSSTSVGLSTTKQFAASGHDSSGSQVGIDPSWSIFGSLGTIDADGLFYAGSQIGTTYVVASASGFSGQAAVTITDKGSITGTVRNSVGSALNGITVTATQAAKSDETDASGVYSISELSEGIYTVETEATVRYLSSLAEVTVTMAAGATKNFTLSNRISIVTGTPSRVGTSMSIVGTVRNNGSSTATSCSVVYIFYDEDNFPMGNGSVSVGDMGAGSTEAFSLSVSLNEDKDPSRTESYGVAGGF